MNLIREQQHIVEPRESHLEHVITHRWMSHGAQMNESGHTCRWVMDLIREQQHKVEPREAREYYLEHVMAHRRMSHSTQMNEAQHTYEWVMAHILEQQYIAEPREAHSYHLKQWEWVTNTDGWDTAHIHMNHSAYSWAATSSATPWNPWILPPTSHGTHGNELWHTCEWVTARRGMRHGPCVNESWHRCRWVMVHILEQQHIVETCEAR